MLLLLWDLPHTQALGWRQGRNEGHEQPKTTIQTMLKIHEFMKYLVCLGVMAALGAMAQTNTTPQTASSSSGEEDIRFKQGEFDFSPFATYSDQTGGKWGAGAEVTYFLLRNVGIGAA